MNRRISTEFAVAIIVIIASFFVGIFFLGDRSVSDNTVSSIAISDVEKQADASECKPHYYDAEGEARISGWMVGDDGRGGIIMQIAKEDVKNLPASKDGSMVVDSNPKVDLVDPSVDVKNSLSGSSSEKPVTITVKGYAETCDSIIPSVSMDLATVSLKKS